MKKCISSFLMFALLFATTIAPVQAVGITIDSAVYADGDGTGTITVTDSGKDYAADAIAAWSVTTSAGVAVTSGTTAEVTEANGSFVIGTALLDNLAADTYTMLFTTVANDYSGAIVTVGNVDQVVVTAVVEPILSFSLGANSVDLGVLANTSVKSASHTVTAASNATSGYTITVTGATLTDSTSGATITPIGATAAASNLGEAEQFGLNVVDNATPNIGAIPSGGAGIGVGQFAIADSFAFAAGVPNTIASSNNDPSGSTVYTVSYIANIASNTDAGSYATTLTYVVVPIF